MAFGGGIGEVARLITTLDLKDNFTRPLRAADSQLTQFQRSGETLGHGIRQVGSGLTTLGIRAGVAAAGGLTAVVKTAIDFESAFAGVAKTVDATAPQLAEMEQGFLDLSKTIPLSVEELENIGAQAGALGIAREDILSFTDTVAKIGATTNVTSDQAATALGQLSNVLDLTADDFDNFGAALVDLGNKGASTEAQILEIASRSGAGAGLIGIAADKTLGWASAVANLGVQTEAGGSALQQFFLQAQKNLTIDERLALMADTAGMTGKAFKKAFGEDATGALQTFLQGLGKLPAAARLSVLDDAGFKGIRLQRVLLGLAGDSDNLTKSLNTASDAWEKNTALNEEFGKRAATTESALRILVNNVRIAANTIGSELLPVLRDLSAEFVDFLNKPSTQKGIRDFAKGLADGIRGFVSQFKSGQFDGIIQSLKDAAGVMKIAFDAFNALPGPLKSALIAGAVVNRATGGALGLITSGLVNITKGVGGLLSRGGSPATPLFVKDVGLPGGGGGLPATGGGGLASGLLKATIFGAVALGIAEGLHQVADIVDPGNEARKQAFTESGGGFLGLEGVFRKWFGPPRPQGAATPTGQFNPANAGGTRPVVPVEGGSVPVNVKQLPAPMFDKLSKELKASQDNIGQAVRDGNIKAAKSALDQLRSTRDLLGPHGPGHAIDKFSDRMATAQEKLRQAIRDGDGKAARNAQRQIAEIANQRREAKHGQDQIRTGLQSVRDRVTGGLDKLHAIEERILAKDTTPRVNVSVTSYTSVSISDVIRQSFVSRIAQNVPAGFVP